MIIDIFGNLIFLILWLLANSTLLVLNYCNLIFETTTAKNKAQAKNLVMWYYNYGACQLYVKYFLVTSVIYIQVLYASKCFFLQYCDYSVSSENSSVTHYVKGSQWQ